MGTNHSYQTPSITQKTPPPCRVQCGEYNGVMFMVGECSGCILDLKIFRGGLPKKVKKVFFKEKNSFVLDTDTDITSWQGLEGCE